MNIVDMLKSQLGGEVLSKLSSLIGEGEDKTRTAVDAAIPALLSSLAGLASTSGGADRLINALRQASESPDIGGLGDVLREGPKASEWLAKGGSLLSVLLGSAALPALLGILGKFAGLAAGPMKGLLSYLAPLILAQIAKQLSGGALTHQRLSSFFEEQKPNITAAMPAGLSLADLPGFGATASAPGAVEGTGLPNWLAPLVGLALLAGLVYWFMNAPSEEPAAPTAGAPSTAGRGPMPSMGGRGGPASKKGMMPPTEAPPVAKEAAAALPDAAKLVTDLGGVFTNATQYLTDVKDAATADTALPKLKDVLTQVEGYKTLWDKLPDAGKATVTKVVTDHLGTLTELVNKVLAIPGIGDKLKPILDALLAALSGFKV